jgi:hypothetical protein
MCKSHGTSHGAGGDCDVSAEEAWVWVALFVIFVLAGLVWCIFS